MLFEEDTSTHFLKASHVPVGGTEHALVSFKIDAVMLNAEARVAQRARGPELSRRDIVVGHSLESHGPSSMAGMREGSLRGLNASLCLFYPVSAVSATAFTYYFRPYRAASPEPQRSTRPAPYKRNSREPWRPQRADRLRAMRNVGESYSDVILRIAAGGPRPFRASAL